MSVNSSATAERTSTSYLIVGDDPPASPACESYAFHLSVAAFFSITKSLDGFIVGFAFDGGGGDDGGEQISHDRGHANA